MFFCFALFVFVLHCVPIVDCVSGFLIAHHFSLIYKGIGMISVISDSHFWQKMKLGAQWAELVWIACHFILRKFYTEPSIGASYQISINLVKCFFFKLANHILHMVAILVVWPARNMAILYRISHMSFLQSNNSVCLLVLEKKIFRNWPTRNKNCLWPQRL